ncbi:MAG: LPXTG cell wall anchor domain-containing protein [Eggerthellaceae bacterium]|nr:LPXTG cell wall anchor domain-containing protein [Eggerthellaceae bacterium]
MEPTAAYSASAGMLAATGDATMVIVPVAIAILAAALLTFAIIMRRRGGR